MKNWNSQPTLILSLGSKSCSHSPVCISRTHWHYLVSVALVLSIFCLGKWLGCLFQEASEQHITFKESIPDSLNLKFLKSCALIFSSILDSDFYSIPSLIFEKPRWNFTFNSQYTRVALPFAEMLPKLWSEQQTRVCLVSRCVDDLWRVSFF